MASPHSDTIYIFKTKNFPVWKIGKTFERGTTMKKFLNKLMGYKFIYRLMPKWIKFEHCFEVMAKNRSGTLHLGNGYGLNFKDMIIECYNDEED